jgi:hypothetical protein
MSDKKCCLSRYLERRRQQQQQQCCNNYSAYQYQCYYQQQQQQQQPPPPQQQYYYNPYSSYSNQQYYHTYQPPPPQPKPKVIYVRLKEPIKFVKTSASESNSSSNADNYKPYKHVKKSKKSKGKNNQQQEITTTKTTYTIDSRPPPIPKLSSNDEYEPVYSSNNKPISMAQFSSDETYELANVYHQSLITPETANINTVVNNETINEGEANQMATVNTVEIIDEQIEQTSFPTTYSISLPIVHISNETTSGSQPVTIDERRTPPSSTRYESVIISKSESIENLRTPPPSSPIPVNPKESVIISKSESIENLRTPPPSSPIPVNPKESVIISKSESNEKVNINNFETISAYFKETTPTTPQINTTSYLTSAVTTTTTKPSESNSDVKQIEMNIKLILTQSKPQKYTSEIEKAIYNSAQPIETGQHEEIEIPELGIRGIWINKSETENWTPGDVPLSEYKINIDPNPELVKLKYPKCIERIEAKAVKFLRPPTPPPPGDIVITQLPDYQPPEAPPIIIRQLAEDHCDPKPKIIRERPPTPPEVLESKNIYLPGKILDPPPRRVIIEKLAKQPDEIQGITVERWLPYEEQKRRVIFNDAQPVQPINVEKNIEYVWEPPCVENRVEIQNHGIETVDPVAYLGIFSLFIYICFLINIYLYINN